MPRPDPRSTPDEDGMRRIAVGIGLLVAILALVVLVGGWLGGIESLRHPIPGTSTMKVNTALGLFSLGTSIALMAAQRSRVLVIIAAACALFIGSATLIEYAFGITSHTFDNLIVQDHSIDSGLYPGRPGITTSLTFVALSLGLLLIAIDRYVSTALLIAAAAGIIAYLTILGYIMNAGVLLTADAEWTQMAVHTSAGIFLCSTAVPLICIDKGYVRIVSAPQSGGRQARFLLPGVLLVGIVLALAIRLMQNLDIPEPIPSQIITAVFIVIMLIAIVVVAGYTNRTEKQRQRNDIISTAVDAALEGVLIVGVDGAIEEVNQTICDMSGYTREQLIGQSIEMLVPNRHRVAHLVDRHQFWQEGVNRRMRAGRQTVMIDAFGIEMQVDISLGFVRLGDSSKAVIATVRDTSELVRANRELEQFAYVASHDLRAPLRAVIGFTDLLKSSFWETPLDEDQNDYLNEIILGAQRMNTLIDSLLAYSRIGRKAPERSTTIITEEVSRIRDELVDELAQAQATVRMDVAPDLTWDVNAALMASAITNILENAIKYRSPARPLQIDIRAGRAQKVSFVSFTDNGSGIAPDALERATEMFQRLTTDGAGIGIGLASVKRIAELHGGAVQIRSDGSSYTEVTLRIPDAPPQRATGGST